MKRFESIIESEYPPKTNTLWLYNGELRYFHNGIWEVLCEMKSKEEVEGLDKTLIIEADLEDQSEIETIDLYTGTIKKGTTLQFYAYSPSSNVQLYYSVSGITANGEKVRFNNTIIYEEDDSTFETWYNESLYVTETDQDFVKIVGELNGSKGTWNIEMRMVREGTNSDFSYIVIAGNPGYDPHAIRIDDRNYSYSVKKTKIYCTKFAGTVDGGRYTMGPDGVTYLDLSHLHSDNTDFTHVLNGLIGIDRFSTGLDTSKGKTFRSFLAGGTESQIDTGVFDLKYATDVSNMFASCQASKIIFRSGVLKSFFIENFAGLFYNCAATNIDLYIVPTSFAKNMSSMFYYCTELSTLNFKETGTIVNTSNVTTFQSIFAYCIALTTLNIASWSTKGVINAQGMLDMFKSCKFTNLTLGKEFFATPASDVVVDLSTSTGWSNATTTTSLVTNLYDRQANALPTLTLKLSTQTKNYLGSDIEAIKEKGYTIS
jgi:hypothetical protein